MDLVHLLKVGLRPNNHNPSCKKIFEGFKLLVGCIVLLCLINSLEVKSLKDLELTTSTSCTECECKAGEYANDFVVCDGSTIEGLQEITILSLPHYVNSIQISNASQVVFKRGAIRVSEDKTFSIFIKDVKRTQMNDKSLTLISATSQLKVNVDNVEDLKLQRRFVSAKTGTVDISIGAVDTVYVEGRAFDVLDKMIMQNVGILHLEQLAFKPNVPPPLQQPKFVAEFTNIRQIASIPSDSFPSAARIMFTRCNISDLETNAFSGNQMTNLTFNNTSIDRIHTHAFPEKSLIVKLEFVACDLSSVSQKAIASAMSLLEVRNSRITSISQEAFHCPVAKVILYENTFSTISSRTFLFESWSNLTIDFNHFKFVESEAFAELSASDPNVKFSFKGNHIHYANQNALRLLSLPMKITADVSDNVFHKECDCEFQNWLNKVCSGASSEGFQGLDFEGLIKNTSYCAVPDLAVDCFENNIYVLINTYTKLSCTSDYNDYQDTACMKSASTAWDDFQEQLEVTSNKGILLIVLLFVLASSLVVGILTLLRWIVYSFQMRGKYSDADDDWNFTKVEERLIAHTSDDQVNNSPSSFNGSLIQHYESLPLTTTEVMMESTPSTSPTKANIITNKETLSNKSSLRSTKHSKAYHEDAVNEESAGKEHLLKESLITHDAENIGSSTSNATRSSLTTPDIQVADISWKKNSSNTPKQSFFDEMIDLLTEKLEDPDNYGTVLDTRNKSSENSQQVVYQDPVTLTFDT